MTASWPRAGSHHTARHKMTCDKCGRSFIANGFGSHRAACTGGLSASASPRLPQGMDLCGCGSGYFKVRKAPHCSACESYDDGGRMAELNRLLGVRV